MAAQITLPSRRIISQAGRVNVARQASHLSLLPKLLFAYEVAAIVVAAALLISFAKAYSDYRQFAGVIDQQIASGFLKSHAGFYAAPRVIERGAYLSQQQLIATLQKAGYAAEASSNIWNGSYQTSDKSVLIFPRRGSDAHEWIKVTFAQGHIAELKANDQANLSSYALESELLTEDTANKLGERETLTFQDIPNVMVQAILAIEDRRFFQH